MRLRTRVSRVRLGRDEYRVIQPRYRLERASVSADPGEWGTPRCLQMYVDRTAAAVLGASWTLATISRRSLVYVPMRHAALPDGVAPCPPSPSLDLVLMHHCLQFRRSRWRQVRARLGQGSPHVARVALPPEYVEDAPLPGRNERDELRFDIAGETLFVTGSTRAFEEWGHLLRGLAVDGGPYVKAHRGTSHYCVEIDNRWRLPTHSRAWTQWHIEYCPRWRS